MCLSTLQVHFWSTLCAHIEYSQGSVLVDFGSGLMVLSSPPFWSTFVDKASRRVRRVGRLWKSTLVPSSRPLWSAFVDKASLRIRRVCRLWKSSHGARPLWSAFVDKASRRVPGVCRTWKSTHGALLAPIVERVRRHCKSTRSTCLSTLGVAFDVIGAFLAPTLGRVIGVFF